MRFPVKIPASSLTKDFLLFACSLIAIIFLVFAWHVNSIIEQLRLRKMEIMAHNVERGLTENIDYFQYLMEFCAFQITQNSPEAPSYNNINNLLTGFNNNPKRNQLLSLNMVDWIDTDKQLVISSTKGILQKPVDLSVSRPTINEALQKPGTFFIGEQATGVISGEQIIPISMGVANQRGQTIGVLHIALNVKGIASKIEQLLGNSGMKFAILNDNHEILMQSSDTELENGFFKEIDQLIATSGMLPRVLKANGIIYNTYRMSSKHHYLIILGYDTKADAIMLKEKLLLPLMFCGIIAAVSLLLLYYFHSRIITPIIRLSKTAETIAGGNYAIRIKEHQSGEIGKLTHSFNTMVEKIDESRLVLEQRVAERTQSLQEALNSREEFFNHVGHEIRTPVSSIYARTAVLLEMWERFDKQALRESIEDIQSNALRICDFVTSLLDLAKSRAGKITYEMKQHDIAKLAEQVAEECRPLYERKLLMLQVKNNAINTVTSCDAIRIEQVLRNLLSNACRYTAEGEVVLSISNTDMQCDDGTTRSAIAIAVKDSGIGIPPAELKHIFEVFAQSSKTHNRTGTTGLGLAICLEIITAHHGHIWAENNSKGKGSTFNCVIPLT